MASNITGNKSLDHAVMMTLCESAFEFSKTALVKGGTLVMKMIQGGEENKLASRMKECFDSVKFFKPQASRKDSSEIYIVAERHLAQSSQLCF